MASEQPDDETEQSYQNLRSALAARSAAVAKIEADHRELLRIDPEYKRGCWEHARCRGELKALAEALRDLQETPTERFDAVDFARSLWRKHKDTNEWRSESTGRTEAAAKGWHTGFGSALNACRETAGVEFADYGPKEATA